jgi:hypothetical protein
MQHYKVMAYGKGIGYEGQRIDERIKINEG